MPHNISRACIMHFQGEKGSKGDTGSKGDNGSPCQCSLQVKANSWQIATGIVVKQFFNSNKTQCKYNEIFWKLSSSQHTLTL